MKESISPTQKARNYAVANSDNASELYDPYKFVILLSFEWN
jgi:hypothetical protein